MRRHTPILVILFVGLCLCRAVSADTSTYSGITFFRSDVTVKPDATLEVREEIAVSNAASFYKYGFRRDLPISPLERWEVRYVGPYRRDNGVRFKVLEVTEDGAPVPYEQGTGFGYAQLFIGQRGMPLDPGEHRYVIRYTVDFALNVGPARDMLYWNAIGNERNAPVAEAILAVHLPAAIPGESVEAEPRVGGRGGSLPRQPETVLERLEDPSGAIVYRTTNVSPRQSLSLAVTWPSGYIHPPKLRIFVRDYWMLAAPALLFLFYFFAWLRIRPGPRPGPLVTRYEPPEGLSPAGARYIATGTTDGHSFAAVIADLAVNKCIRVEPINGKYKLSRLLGDRAAEEALAPEEKRVLASLFEDEPTVALSPAMDQRNTNQNARYISQIHEELNKQLGQKYLTRHFGVIALAVLATFVSALLLAATAQGRDTTGAVFLTMWILFVGLTLGLMIEMTFASAWKSAIRAGTGWVKLLPGLGTMALFVGVIAFMLRKLAAGISPSFAFVVVALLLINLGWGPWLKRKSPLGQQVTDQIAGFRQFLQKVEQGQLDRLNSAEQTPQELDRFLPYAIALEVKEAWGDHLAQAMPAYAVVAEN